jgi:hypothetical protein
MRAAGPYVTRLGQFPSVRSAVSSRALDSERIDRIVREVEAEEPASAAGATSGGDVARLRGLPAVARGSSGSVPGTDRYAPCWRRNVDAGSRKGAQPARGCRRRTLLLFLEEAREPSRANPDRLGREAVHILSALGFVVDLREVTPPTVLAVLELCRGRRGGGGVTGGFMGAGVAGVGVSDLARSSSISSGHSSSTRRIASGRERRARRSGFFAVVGAFEQLGGLDELSFAGPGRASFRRDGAP